VPFCDSEALACATLRFFGNQSFQLETRRLAYEYAKPMWWSNVGRQYLELFERVASASEAVPAGPFSTSCLGHTSRHEAGDLLLGGL
jgi:hypothetical protein